MSTIDTQAPPQKPPVKTGKAFPAKDIETAIRDCLDAIGGDQAILRGTASGDSGDGAAGSGVGPQPVIDSLVVVCVLCELEPLVPFDLPDTLVRAGGYNSLEEALGHLMPKIKEKWHKYYKESK